MTVKECITGMSGVIKKSASAIWNGIMEANVSTLIKLGIVTGAAVATVFAILKFMRDKRKMYYDDEDVSVVDRALDMNFNDVRNQEELHPLMKKVKKNLKKELKPRKVKTSNSSINAKYFDKILRERDNDELRERYENFLAHLEEDEIFEREVAKYPSQRTLRNVWENS